MRILIHTSLLLLVGVTLTSKPVPGTSHEVEPSSRRPPGTSTTTEKGIELGEVCATGCAAEPEANRSAAMEDVHRWLGAMSRGEDEAALDSLLFHADAARAALDEGEHGLSAEEERWLRAELARTHAYLDVRMIDERGIERLRLGSKRERVRIPLGEKQHLHPASTDRLSPPEVSGTVQRVGREHLWARL